MLFMVSLRNTSSLSTVMQDTFVDEEGLELILKRVLRILINKRVTFIENVRSGGKWTIEQEHSSSELYRLTAQKVDPT